MIDFVVKYEIEL